MLAEEGDRVTTSVPRSTGQSTESVERVGRAAPTYLRTYGLTKNLQDPGDNLAPRNAHENSDGFDSTRPANTTSPRPYCPVPGHDDHRADHCQACRSEWLETGCWPAGTRHPMAASFTTPPTTDARTRAAGMAEED